MKKPKVKASGLVVAGAVVAVAAAVLAVRKKKNRGSQAMKADPRDPRNDALGGVVSHFQE